MRSFSIGTQTVKSPSGQRGKLLYDRRQPFIHERVAKILMRALSDYVDAHDLGEMFSRSLV